jgi:hypothetical protein
MYEDNDNHFAVLADLVPDDVARLGVDVGHAPREWVDELDDRLDATPVGADDLFTELRTVKPTGNCL